MKLRKASHTVYMTQYHIAWVSRFRRKILVKWVDSYLKNILITIARKQDNREIFETWTDKDHLHIHMVIPPKIAVSKVMEIMKSNSSRILKEKFDFLWRVYWDWKWIWWTGFYVSTVGFNEEEIRKYVESQWDEDKTQP